MTNSGHHTEPSQRRVVALYVTGILLGYAAGFVTAILLWGLSLVH